MINPDDILAESSGRVASAESANWAEKERLMLASCPPKQLAFVEDPGRRIAALVGRGGGKGLPLDEPVMTPGGEKRIADLVVGSRVCATDGTVSQVIGVYPQGVRPVFEIEFDDGAIARCDDQHIWPIHIQGKRRDKTTGRNQEPIEGPGYRLMTMAEVMRCFAAGQRVHVPTMDRPASMPWKSCNRKAPALSPYLVGLLLGDGSLRDLDVRYCTVDAELADVVLSAGFREHTPDRRNGLRTMRAPVNGDVYRALSDLGLVGKRSWEKSVPRQFMIADCEDRLAVLQGLMDTDGYVSDDGKVSFCSSSKKMSMDVQWLVRSLGGKATLREKKTKRRPAHIVFIQTGGKFNPFRLRRKALRYRPYQHQKLWRRVVAIRDLEPAETVCIKVDHHTGLFITRDFVVTHNTTGGRVRLVRRMMRTARAQCLFIATTRQQAEELMWTPLKDLVERLGIDAKFNETKLRMTFRRNGSTLRLVGADDKREIEKLRGIPHHEVGIDESASHPAQLLEHLLFRILGPRMGDFNGVIWTIGTPGHIMAGPFYDATRPGTELGRLYSERDLPEYADWKKWSLHKWSLRENTTDKGRKLWAEALIEKEANGWSDDHPVWRREFLGEWAADDTERVYKFRRHLDDGLPWNIWTPGEKTKDNPFGLPKDHDWEFVYGLDMGHSDPFALQILAYSDTCRYLYQVYEFVKKGMYVREIAQLMIGEALDHDNLGGLFYMTGYPVGIVADTAGLGGAILDELRTVYGITAEKAEKKHKHDAVELLNGDLVDGLIKILSGSKLEEEWLHLQWAVGEFGVMKENKAQSNHSSDAFLYARRKALHLFGNEDNRRIKTEQAEKEAARHPNRDGYLAQLSAQRDDADEFSEFIDLSDDGGMTDFFE